MQLEMGSNNGCGNPSEAPSPWNPDIESAYELGEDSVVFVGPTCIRTAWPRSFLAAVHPVASPRLSPPLLHRAAAVQPDDARCPEAVHGCGGGVVRLCCVRPHLCRLPTLSPVHGIHLSSCNHGEEHYEIMN